MVTETAFVIAVPNLETSAAFYRDVLGFSVGWQDVPGWRLFVRDRCRIMAGECPDAPSPRDIGDHAYFAYLTVDDVDDYHQRVRDSATEIVKPLRDEPWGMREFGLRTVDGHRMMIGSEIAKKQ